MKTKYLAIAAISTVLLAACTRRIYVPTEHLILRTDTLRHTARSTDSIWQRDSIHIIERGDTVTREVYRWRFRDRIVHDTIATATAVSESHTLPPPATTEAPQDTRKDGDRSSVTPLILIAAIILAAIIILRLQRRMQS